MGVGLVGEWELGWWGEWELGWWVNGGWVGG